VGKNSLRPCDDVSRWHSLSSQFLAIDELMRNEEQGIFYGQGRGYDGKSNEEEVIWLLKNGLPDKAFICYQTLLLSDPFYCHS
jgi:hypothetical protein